MFFKAAIPLALFAFAAPAMAQVDLDMSFNQSAGDAARNAMLGAGTQHAARRNRTRNGEMSKEERARGTCQSGRRMRAQGDPNPNLLRLEAMCVKAGL